MQGSTSLAPGAPRQELKDALQELKDALYNRALELDGAASLKAMQTVNRAVARDDAGAARELADAWGVEPRPREGDGGAAPLTVLRSSIELEKVDFEYRRGGATSCAPEEATERASAVPPWFTGTSYDRQSPEERPTLARPTRCTSGRSPSPSRGCSEARS